MDTKQSSDRPSKHDVGQAAYELGVSDTPGRILQAKVDELFRIINELEHRPSHRFGRHLFRLPLIEQLYTGPIVHGVSTTARTVKRAVRTAPRLARTLRRDTITAHFTHKLGWKAAFAATGLTMPEAKHPDVSIIIPAYNKIDLTVECLASLTRVNTKYSYEVIVIDNASADATPAVLSAIPHLVYVRNEENAGFVDGCNQGADLARGKTLVFLNNDTQVAEDWLDPLIDTLSEDSVGIAGSMLLYPDGTLQEAGGIIYADASGHNYGKGHHPGGYRYNFTRPVDYCSGASIAISHDLFNEVGKFDRRYAPAYYEDTDLAFSVRAKGLQVMYQPASRLFHIEGATAGTSTTGGGYKRFQAINHDKFLDKWQTVLERDHAAAGTHPDRALALRHSKRALIVDHIVPTPDRDSGSVRMTALVHELQAMGYAVTFWPDNLTALEPYTRSLQSLGVEVVFGDENFTEHVYVHENQYELAILSRPSVAPSYMQAVRDSQPNATIIYDTVDLAYVRVQRQAELDNNPATVHEAALWRTVELGMIHQADATLVVSPTEEKLLAETMPEAVVGVVSNIHRSARDDIPGFKDRSGLVFIGGYDHTPNRDAMIWFTSHVLPLVREKIDCTITILGSNPTPEILALDAEDGVTVVGYVPDVAPFFNAARIFVSPLRYGAGVKGKIGQAFEHSLPVVTTPVGAEGMYIKNGHDALIATDAKDFAEAIIRLYEDESLWNELRTGSANLLEQHFSPTAARSALTRVLEGVKQA